MTVDDSVDYTINENSGSVNIIVLLDRPSCHPITVIANPQVRSPPSATGNNPFNMVSQYIYNILIPANDFINTAVRVTINPGENTTTVPIGIINDDLLEDTEIFDVVFSTSGNVGAAMRQPKVAEVAIASEDG